MSAEAAKFALDTLVEVHDGDELKRAIALEHDILGINNRDLRTFEPDLGVTIHLLSSIPAGRIVISESGVHEPEDVAELYAAGAHGF